MESELNAIFYSLHFVPQNEFVCLLFFFFACNIHVDCYVMGFSSCDLQNNNVYRLSYRLRLTLTGFLSPKRREL